MVLFGLIKLKVCRWLVKSVRKRSNILVGMVRKGFCLILLWIFNWNKLLFIIGEKYLLKYNYLIYK